MAANDTIFALSSGGLPAGVAVVRVSGPATKDALHALCGRVPALRVATLMTVRGRDAEELDRGLVLFFQAPASFTGEDCAELQVHGGRAIVAAILEALGAMPGLRQAEAGEFARRAFDNGKMDLVEAEGLAELVQAETQAQRRLAKYLADGHLSRRYEAWMSRLSQSRALIEAELDFADEGDIPGSVSEQVWKDVKGLAHEMEAALSDHTAEIVRDGYRVAIAGPPNAGKSSLLNYLAQRDVAIVTDIAGTTRDVLSVDLDLDGLKIVLFDTAGLRHTDDPVERIGIQRARATIDAADLVLYLSETGAIESTESSWMPRGTGDVVMVRSKADRNLALDDTGHVSLSTVTGEGVDSLLKQISARATDAIRGGQFLTPLLIRHRNHVGTAAAALREAHESVDLPLEVRAELMRAASDELSHLTGRVTPDALLGLIFSQFCVGK
ncbi:tRNA uridine-5-carboxymethylaminomethyl(34) synthesis GTPase MnmE [Rhizobium sp. C4]|uniref:tRNA uridine-5-carboxymethylaminomethyl(34) synthesis GTPase MnmE n=1 Tax=Rhizobium sp. C4 TaxID=1349800 RepID=UPI001E523DA3|nr:tRNA uridine-5-carboxymethylaminomethyl(34) synthesis GTPase MnmE [Rhizobium sp. C4]MCD2174698.1 tRNA uridine-5-carboxymethylaminomethyl(34) synthesis GTPase MnmE [Rhizobium sp. C4]